MKWSFLDYVSDQLGYALCKRIADGREEVYTPPTLTGELGDYDSPP